MRSLLRQVPVIGVDTTILVRYLIQDDEKQTVRAVKFLESHCTVATPGFISCTVLCELTWLLHKGYKFAKPDIINLLRGLLGTKQFCVEDEVQAWLALRDDEQDSADDDYLLAHRNQQRGCTHTVTFDRKAAKHWLFKVL